MSRNLDFAMDNVYRNRNILRQLNTSDLDAQSDLIHKSMQSLGMKPMS